MNKAHSPINWQNKPSTNTPINETNLNKMDNEIGTLDDRIVALDVSKANATDVLASFTGASYNQSNGVLTFTRANGTAVTVDTKLEKLAVNFAYNSTTQKLIITLDDGTKQEVDLSALINEYDFQTSDTVSFTVVNGKVKAEIIDGSVTEDKLQPNYLADIKVEVAKANNAGAQADLAKSYAVGGTGTRAGEDTDNARFYSEQAKAVAQIDIATTSKAGIVKPDGTSVTVDPDGTMHAQSENVAWDDIEGKPGTFPPSTHTHTKSEITDFPSIPTVNNKTITIQKNGTNVDSFTTNASANKTINITVDKGDVGLGNVDNTSDASKSVASAVTASGTNTAVGQLRNVVFTQTAPNVGEVSDLPIGTIIAVYE